NSGWYAWVWLAGGSRGRFFTRQDHARCALKVKPGNVYRVSFYYRASRPDRTCPFNANPTAPPCPIGGQATAASTLDGTGEELPFGYTGDDERMFTATDLTVPSGPGAAAADGAKYELIYAWRKPNGTYSAANDGYWMPFNVVLEQDLPLDPGTAWRPVSFTLPSAPNSTGTTTFSADSLSFGIQLTRGSATGRVALDVDSFAYCRVTNDSTDPVPACGP
ncbi:MAG: hypothetical protein ACOY0T_35700, partial [Myxococcota bacterium]